MSVAPDLIRQIAVRACGVDWFRVIVDLERSGLSQAAIGERIERSQSQVNAYKTIPDTEPSFHHGMLLLGLWEERCAGEGGPPML